VAPEQGILLDVNAATRAASTEYRATTAQWHADRRARRPKVVAKMAANEKLPEYVQDRLSAVITRLDGTPVPGPTVRIIGRRHGRRQDRRWADQISHRLQVSSPMMSPCASLTRPFIRR
jgi:hypothetical protein